MKLKIEKQQRKIKEPKSCVFKKSNKIDKLLVRPNKHTKKGRYKFPILKIKQNTSSHLIDIIKNNNGI